MGKWSYAVGNNFACRPKRNWKKFWCKHDKNALLVDETMIMLEADGKTNFMGEYMRAFKSFNSKWIKRQQNVIYWYNKCRKERRIKAVALSQNK